MPIVAAAAIGAGGALLSSRSQSKAAQSAANASQQASDAAVAEQRRQYDLARQDQAPWLRTGQSALSQLAGLYGLNASGGSASQSPYNADGSFNYSQPLQMTLHGGRYGSLSNDAFIQGDSGSVLSNNPVGQQAVADTSASNGSASLGSFWQSPDYQFRMNEQMRALAARNAALGIQDSGAAQRSALQYSGNLASGEFNNYANRLSSLAGVGQTAANNNAQYGQNFANNYTNILGNNAQNLASSYQQQGAANANLWSTLAGIGGGIVGRL